MLLQLFDRSERCAVQRLALKDGKPSLDPIEPRRPRRGEMEVDVWMFLEPAIALLMGSLLSSCRRGRLSDLASRWHVRRLATGALRIVRIVRMVLQRPVWPTTKGTRDRRRIQVLRLLHSPQEPRGLLDRLTPRPCAASTTRPARHRLRPRDAARANAASGLAVSRRRPPGPRPGRRSRRPGRRRPTGSRRRWPTRRACRPARPAR